MSESIISNERKCFVCGTPLNLHKHHIFYGSANRKKAEQDGCWCYLCANHHNMSGQGVHFNKMLDKSLKIQCERAWIEKYGKKKEDFISRFGRSYL